MKCIIRPSRSSARRSSRILCCRWGICGCGCLRCLTGIFCRRCGGRSWGLVIVRVRRRRNTLFSFCIITSIALSPRTRSFIRWLWVSCGASRSRGSSFIFRRYSSRLSCLSLGGFSCFLEVAAIATLTQLWAFSITLFTLLAATWVSVQWPLISILLFLLHYRSFITALAFTIAYSSLLVHSLILWWGSSSIIRIGFWLYSFIQKDWWFIFRSSWRISRIYQLLLWSAYKWLMFPPEHSLALIIVYSFAVFIFISFWSDPP